MVETDIQQEIGNRQETIPLIKYDHAIVVGVGGIGSWVALNLALSGQITKLHIIDPDIVESSNLNRTPFRICDIGNPKVDALKYIILERRMMEIYTYQKRTDDTLLKKLKHDFGLDRNSFPISQIIDSAVIVDCRDDVYEDMYDFPFKYYKLGADGLSATLDGNPRNTAVWGQANGYRVTPSFICPSQLIANLAVTDILTEKITPEEMKQLSIRYDVTTNNSEFDMYGRFNKVVTFDCKNLMEIIYRDSWEINPRT